jgi:hypothetical protein
VAGPSPTPIYVPTATPLSAIAEQAIPAEEGAPSPKIAEDQAERPPEGPPPLTLVAWALIGLGAAGLLAVAVAVIARLARRRPV